MSKRDPLMEEMEEWVTRVLGWHFGAPPGGPPGSDAAARFEAARPAEAPKAAMTANLLAAMARAAPDAAEELPAILAGMIPRFLLAIQSEPNMDAQPMAEGTQVSAQDQMLAVANSLNAVLRSARLWETLLGQAEQADGTIDSMEKTARDPTQQKDYEELVTSYNATRMAALAEETRCEQLVTALAAEFRAAQTVAAQGTAAQGTAAQGTARR